MASEREALASLSEGSIQYIQYWEKMMAEKNKLSIYMVKDAYANTDQSILKNGAQLLANLDNIGKVYYIPSQTNVPSWVTSFFRGNLKGASIFTSNARVVLISRVQISEGLIKTFSITMGYGKNMLEEDVLEEDFGLKVVLNTITPSSLRRINKVNIGGNQKTSNEQLPLESDIDDFGFDIERDLISTITGQSDDDGFASGIMTGSNLLSLTAEVDINNLHRFLKTAYARYVSEDYKRYFGWVDHIKRVKSSSTIDELDALLIQMINEESPKVWMAVPDVIEWEYVKGFKYAGREIHDDIDIAKVRLNFKNPLTHVDQLKQKRITAIRTDNETTYTSWNAYRCIYAELEHNGRAYCLNNGRWFCIDKDFVTRINKEYESFPVSNMKFIPHNSEHTTENKYTQAFVQSDTTHLLCMDAKVIYHGGGQSKIELCDVLTVDNTYIHIKLYSGSATLSHLFNQAVVSAELVMSDHEFREKANRKIKEMHAGDEFLIPSNCRPRVILAIISKHTGERPPLPFFSKIAIRYTIKRLQTFGCEVYIKNIPKSTV